MRLQFAASVTLILWAALPALSQTVAPAPAKPEPLDARAVVPPLVYRSAFEGYRPNVETDLAAWKEANDRVGRIGGWRAYAREAAAPDKPASAAPERKP